MASNPLLGKRISLVSKKNIRYEGILYSINEKNATVALQNVTSFGTEGRETASFVAPAVDAIHPFLLFRGQDIRDLHVHESTAAGAVAEEENRTTSVTGPQDTTTPAQQQPPPFKKEVPAKTAPAAAPKNTAAAPPPPNTRAAASNSHANQRHAAPKQPLQKPRQGGRGSAQVGTGASLLGATTRGKTTTTSQQQPLGEFDFVANQEQFEKVTGRNDDHDDDDDDDDEAGDAPAPPTNRSSTAKSNDGSMDNGFFDSISCDALDKEAGVDYRLRGAHERHLNTETFGAVALKKGRGGGRGRGRNSNNYPRRYNDSNNDNDNGTGRGAGGRGGGGERGRGRGGGRGRGRSGGRDYSSSTGRGADFAQGGNSSTSNRGRGRGSQRQQPMSTTAAVSG